ncbi:magnesium chelatase subunit D [Rhodoligotrophos appendicifer]|uniref:magnesium chelatase subunit D n=1 Tax=Rhodoligotrophos appendicifer TaxID=987056 RepID=UPI001186043B|nr:magnesium chelatase subunit D [Rhodoligotrophos appendicifer]
MTSARKTGPTPWEDALLAAALMVIDPVGLGGIHLRARASPVRDRWLAEMAAMLPADAPLRRIASGVAEARLTGGLDIGATLEGGRPVIETGVLAAADGGVVLVAMAERLTPNAAGIIGMALDSGRIAIERDGLSALQGARFALVAMDEGVEADEALSPVLADRLGLQVDLNGIGWRDCDGVRDVPPIARAKALLPSVGLAEEMMEALCSVAMAGGRGSMRTSLHLAKAARAAAALRGSIAVEIEDAAAAIRLVLGLTASASLPEDVKEDLAEEDRPEGEPDAADGGASAGERERSTAEGLEESIVAAAEARLPERLLAGLDLAKAARGSQASAGKAGAMRNRGTRGRRAGVATTPPTPGARLDVLSTLRQAAPWQRMRARARAAEGVVVAPRLLIRRQDFRYIRYREKTGTTAIFAVDASGSAAVERLAETKGAVELLLGQCYVRRDSVALIAFRGRQAEVLLEPTRSLLRAKRCLSALPGGGGTPLAGGILAALSMAEASSRKGQSVVAIFLTDGRGNVGLDGTTVRDRVADDTLKCASRFRAGNIRSMVIDTAQRPQARAEALARDLGSEYLALPRGGSHVLAHEISARMEG